MPKRYPILTVLRLLAILLISAFWFIPICIIHALRLTRVQSECVRIYYSWVCSCWGIRVKAHGSPAKARPLLMVSNHFSYLDVPVLGGLLPIRFTPKNDVASWPVIGLFCRLSRCIFIDVRSIATPTADEAHSKFGAQHDLILLVYLLNLLGRPVDPTDFADMSKLRKAGCPTVFRALDEGVKDYIQNYLLKSDPHL